MWQHTATSTARKVAYALCLPQLRHAKAGGRDLDATAGHPNATQVNGLNNNMQDRNMPTTRKRRTKKKKEMAPGTNQGKDTLNGGDGRDATSLKKRSGATFVLGWPKADTLSVELGRSSVDIVRFRAEVGRCPSNIGRILATLADSGTRMRPKSGVLGPTSAEFGQNLGEVR